MNEDDLERVTRRVPLILNGNRSGQFSGDRREVIFRGSVDDHFNLDVGRSRGADRRVVRY